MGITIKELLFAWNRMDKRAAIRDFAVLNSRVWTDFRQTPLWRQALVIPLPLLVASCIGLSVGTLAGYPYIGLTIGFVWLPLSMVQFVILTIIGQRIT